MHILLALLCVYSVLVTAKSRSAVMNNFQNPSAESIVPRAPIRKNFLIRSGQSLNLTCPYDVPFYSWTQADQPTKILSDQQRFTIRTVGLEHSGRYVCQAIDGYGANSADFAVRVIDPTSSSAQRECALTSNGVVNLDGPCFLTSYTDRDLNPTKEWGESIVLDCDAVTASSNKEMIYYRWDVMYTGRPLSAGTFTTDPRRLLVRSPIGGSMTSIPSQGKPDLSRYSEPKLSLEHLTLRHNGEYRCSVIRQGPHVETITRTFRLQVKPRADGHVILGERVTNKTVSIGEDVVFKCEVNPDEHRSSTIRWGKSIEQSERIAYESSGKEVIQWAGGTFVVLPSVPLDTQRRLTDGRAGSSHVEPNSNPSALPNTGAITTEASSSQVSQLFIRHAKPSDAGRYVCSVLTEAGRDDHKFVHLFVTGSSGVDIENLTGGGMKRLTVYIAVPIAIFLVCLCVVTYCLVSRRAANRTRRGNRRQRYFYSTPHSQMKSASAASSSSIGVCRNGMTPVGNTWNGTSDPRIRPSPIGTGQNTTSLGYSSTNGSTSLQGNGQMVMTTQGYQTLAQGTACMVPVTYPMLLQSMGTQPPVSAFYGIPDQNAIQGFQQNSFQHANPAVGSEYVLTTNDMSAYHPGTLYQFSNGSAQSAALNPTLVASSPDSSAITGPGSPVNSESTDGRILYQLSQQQANYAAGYQTGGPSASGTTFGFQANHDCDGNPLLQYRMQSDPSQGNPMRA